MLKKIAFVLLGFFLCSFVAPSGTPLPDRSMIYVVGNSKAQILKLLEFGKNLGDFDYVSAHSQILKKLEGIPYGTGGVNPGHKTLVNFNAFNCVTLVESYWALMYSLYETEKGWVSEEDPFLVFAKNLDKIRYYYGRNRGIQTRIHYFTHAMQILEDEDLLDNVARMHGEVYHKDINYMSKTHGSDMRGESLNKVKLAEEKLSARVNYWFPLSKADSYYDHAKDGDIISFASKEDGLDVSHTGIISIKDGLAKITHASQLYGRVVFQQDLKVYLSKRRKLTGFFVYRPQFF